MPKSRTSKRSRVRHKVYTHEKSTKQSSLSKPPVKSDQINGVRKHSEEVLKLIIEINGNLKQIAMNARNRDNMDHIIKDLWRHDTYYRNKIQEHTNACIIKMKLVLGENADNLVIPETFHLGTTDLEHGYVSLENKKEELMAVILSAPAEKPDATFALGTVIPHDEDVLKDLNLEPLLKNKDTVSNILLRNVSTLEIKPDKDKSFYCASVTCTERKKKINFEDI